MNEAVLIQLTTQRTHHLADIIAQYFPDKKPTPEQIDALDVSVYDLSVDEVRIDEAWELYTHRPIKRSGGSYVHDESKEQHVDALTGDLLKEALLVHFHNSDYDIETKPPAVKDLKAAGFVNVSATIRDEVFSRYVEEKQDADQTTNSDNEV